MWPKRRVLTKKFGPALQPTPSEEQRRREGGGTMGNRGFPGPHTIVSAIKVVVSLYCLNPQMRVHSTGCRTRYLDSVTAFL